MVAVSACMGGTLGSGVLPSVKTASPDYCTFNMEILYVDIYRFDTYSMNIL